MTRAILRRAIEKTVTGTGTRVYDAMQTALDALRPIQQRKAIVLFTDGVDWHSESSTFDSTIRDLDESGVIIYPIRFDTRAFTEQLARKQAEEQDGASLPTSSVIRQPSSGNHSADLSPVTSRFQCQTKKIAAAHSPQPSSSARSRPKPESSGLAD